MWAYGHLSDQTIPSEAKWLTVLFSLSLVANALATCTSPDCFTATAYQPNPLRSAAGLPDMVHRPPTATRIGYRFGRRLQAEPNRSHNPRERPHQRCVSVRIRHHARVGLARTRNHVRNGPSPHSHWLLLTTLTSRCQSLWCWLGLLLSNVRLCR